MKTGILAHMPMRIRTNSNWGDLCMCPYVSAKACLLPNSMKGLSKATAIKPTIKAGKSCSGLRGSEDF